MGVGIRIGDELCLERDLFGVFGAPSAEAQRDYRRGTRPAFDLTKEKMVLGVRVVRELFEIYGADLSACNGTPNDHTHTHTHT